MYQKTMNTWFEHPEKVCMDYSTHAAFSLKLAYLLAVGSAKAVVHAVLPDMYVSSTSDVVQEVQKELRRSGCNVD